ncbi:hypothetical protein Gogos_002237 [Gossypium gossypioides]|uniref:40S ribosomal protein S4 n=2 Tax=Gossypium gossypioides TaxID=34282 RepID=A0A7J9CRD6_GOSGO|nr:hypothetical protein [Gossypium gossypioides]
MDDVVPEADSLLHPINPKGDDEAGAKQHGEEKERANGSGFINHLISNLVTAGSDADEENQAKEAEKETMIAGAEAKNEEKGGGFFDQIISNLVSPLSPKAGSISAQGKAEAFGESGLRPEAEKGGGGGGGGMNKEEQTEDGGGIIDNIVSQLPTSLPADDAAPTSDEATILIHIARGLKKHLKRLNAPRHWMLDKLGGAFAPKPSSGPHKSRECLPLILILRNRLKYALTYREVIAILMQRHVMVDGKVRTDKTYPAGFMDVVSIPKTNEDFRLLYDTKGRFRLHAITGDETKFKLCKVRSVQFGQKGIPYLNTYDGRTIRYPDPLIKANDTVKLDLESNKIVDFIKFDVGNVVMVTGGRNRGRVGVIKNREKHKGSFETIHVQDAAGHEFATRLGNVFTIGKGTKPWVSLPKGKGIKLSIIEEARKRLAAQNAA